MADSDGQCSVKRKDDRVCWVERVVKSALNVNRVCAGGERREQEIVSVSRRKTRRWPRDAEYVVGRYRERKIARLNPVGRQVLNGHTVDHRR